MAKKTAKKSAPKKRAKAASPSAGKSPSKPAPKKKPTTPEPLGAEAIGHAAGALWGALSDGGPQTLAALKKASGLPPDVTLMAVGWLAREDKLAFEAKGRSVRVSLR